MGEISAPGCALKGSCREAKPQAGVNSCRGIGIAFPIAYSLVPL